MRKRDILKNFTKYPQVLFPHSLIKKLANEASYITLIDFLPGSSEFWVDCAGTEIQLYGEGYKWLVYMPMDEFWCMTAFYNPAGELFEWYFDITHRNFIDENGIPAIDDLFLDLVVLPNGQVITLDADELQEALDNDEITRDDYNHAYAVHDQLRSSNWTDVDFLHDFCKKLVELC